MRAVDLIERKRDGQELGAAELRELILAFARDEVPDYQMAVFAMATGGDLKDAKSIAAVLLYRETLRESS